MGVVTVTIADADLPEDGHERETLLRDLELQVAALLDESYHGFSGGSVSAEVPG